MATENQDEMSTNEGTEEISEGQVSEENQPTDETSGQGGNAGQSQDDKGTPKPDPAKQALQADLHKERKQRQKAESELGTLTSKVTELTAKAETVDAIQARYDRLEEFLQAAGGPLGKALDSKSFTSALFESDKKIEDIVKQWHKDNPSATSQALGAGSAAPAGGKVDPNQLLRAAAGK